MKKLSQNPWIYELQKPGNLAAAASRLARILGERARGAAIFLLDQSAEKLVLYGAYPLMETSGLELSFGRPEDPLSFCLLEGAEAGVDNLDSGPEQPSMALLRKMYGRSFSRLLAWPLSGALGKILGAAAIIDPPENYGDLEVIVKFGGLVIENLITHERHNHEALEIREEMERSEAERAARKAKLTSVLIGQSAPIKVVRRLIENAARYRGTVLLTGETGTGKELVASAIYGLGRGGPFVKIDCTAIPAHLLESELFGHKKGAFTGAGEDHEGLIASANGGVVLLDEIGEMPLEMQAKLLRLLQERQVRPVGGIKSRAVDVRFIAATNRDLQKAVASGIFRADLYHRLAVFPIHIPPLRERREDIPLLAAHFLAEFGRKFGRPEMSLSARALHYLCCRQYEGNVRELAALVERAFMLSSPLTTLISLEHFTGEVDVSVSSLPEKMALYERQLIEEALTSARGNHARAAEALGIPRRTLSHKVKRQPKQGGWSDRWN